MKFLRKFKPSRILAKQNDHFKTRAIEGALVRAEPVPTLKPGGRPDEKEVKEHLVMYATNTWTMVRLDLGVQDPFQEPGPVPLPALRHMEQGVNFDLGLEKVRVGIVEYDRVFADSPDDIPEERFPDWETVLQKQGWKHDPSGTNKVTLDIDPRLLLALAQAMGSEESVQITFDLRLTKEYPKRKSRYVIGAMRVQARNEESWREPLADGYMMPMRPLGVEKDDA